ncbi:MAG: hypothetical protein H6740_14545 [Alphaproteobacteria bacterium]|nr:hypothetical protein [Alphaproteobacteria bacterium]
MDTLWEIDRPVPGIEVVDDHTLRFHLTEVYPQFLWVLSMNYAAVYPREAVAYYGKGFRHHPVGTGPFQLTEFHPTYRAVFKANPEFREQRVPDPRNRPEDRVPGWDWEADEAAGLLKYAGERVPLVDGMELRFILEDQPRWLYFKAGYADWLIPPKDNQAEALVGSELSPTMRERGVTLALQPELGTVYTCLNTEDEVLRNVDVRRAISLVYDHNWTIANLYSGNAVNALSLIPPGVGGYEPDHHPYKTDDGSADLERARELLARAGYPGGVDPRTGEALRLRFDNSGTGTTQRHFAERFRDEMRRIGVEIDVIVNTWPQMTEKMRKKEFQIAGLAWGFDYPDAQNILQLLYGPNKAPGINRSNYDNPAYNALYDQASTMSDGPERDALYAQMARMVAEDVPWVVRVHRLRAMLNQPWVTGFKYTDVHEQHWRYVHVDADQRRRLVTEWNQPVLWPVIAGAGLLLALIASAVLAGRRPSAPPAKEAA